MQRLGTLFIGFCMVIVSGSVGALLYLVAGLPAAISGLVALTLLLGLAWWQFSALRTADRADLGRQIADLSSTVTDIARILTELSRRIAEVDGKVQAAERRLAVVEASAPDMVHKASEPMAKELAILSSLVKDLAETTADHETALARLSTGVPAVVSTPVIVAPQATAAATTVAKAVVATGPLAGLSETDALSLVRRAVQAGRVEIYLQPIVTLPQRKVRFYEALPRLRADDGSLLEPHDYAALAMRDRLGPEIDLQLLLRCVQVVRRLATRNREVGLFLPLASETLAAGDAMTRYHEFLESNRALASALVFQIGQASLRHLGALEGEALGAIVERGFRIAVNEMRDLRVDPRDLSDRGVRFVKVPAALLLDRTRDTGAEIHPADLTDLLGRHGVELVGEAVETEGQVVDLLDFDLRYGQGVVFAPPKPVRADVFAPETRRPARDPAPAAEPAKPASEGERPAETPSASRRVGGLADLARTTIRRA